MTSLSPAFVRAFAARRRTRRAWLLLGALFVWLGALAVLLLALVGLDLLFAPGPSALTALRATMVLLAAAVLVILMVRVLLEPASATAAALDAEVGDARQSARMALDLCRHPPAEGVARDLAGLAVAAEAERLSARPLRAATPMRRVGRGVAASSAVLLAAAGALALLGPATPAILRRLARPAADLPPHSAHTFKVEPAQPSVLYGGSLELRVEIEGPEIREEVRLLTRGGGATARSSACFREDIRRFAQRLDRVLEPVEIAFATGRARSEWIPVEVILDPRITGSSLRATPPAYSGKPAYEQRAGEAPVRDLTGTRVRLELSSNRPLAGGELLIQRPGAEPRRIAATPVAADRVALEWTLEEDATLEARVTDPRGIASQSPLSFRQMVLPDEPPKVSVRSPGPFVMATPSARLRVEASAEDDLGLVRVDWVRALAGYRDRAAGLGPATPTPGLTETRELDLGALGVEAGQTLEFYLEAVDTNPAGTGRTMSELARVKIISDAEYARMLRTRTSVEQFMGRYRAARQAVDGLRAGIADLRKDLAAGKAKPAEHLDALRSAAEKSESLMRRLHDDFEIYEMDRASKPVLAAALAALEQVKKGLKGLQAGDPKLDDKLASLAAMLAAPAAALEKQEKDAEGVAKIARLMRHARGFQSIVGAQQWVVRRMERYPDPARVSDAGVYRHLGPLQRDIAERLTVFLAELRRLAGEAWEVPGGEAYSAPAMKFEEAIASSGADKAMGNAAVAADNHDGRKLLEEARDALERLLKVLEDPDNEFASACRGQQPGQRGNKNLGELAEGMGFGPGEGRGEGGEGSSGGRTGLDTPVYGPDRTRFAEDGDSGSREGVSPGAGTGRAKLLSVPGSENDPGVAGGTPAISGGVRLEHTPEKYRAAVRRFFGDESTTETPP